MNIQINGEIKKIEPERKLLSLANLIEQLGYHPQLIVVEYNGTIISSKDWEQQQIKDGDNLEIVTIVGGGS